MHSEYTILRRRYKTVGVPCLLNVRQGKNLYSSIEKKFDNIIRMEVVYPLASINGLGGGNRPTLNT